MKQYLEHELKARGVDTSAVTYRVHSGKDGQHVVALLKGKVIGLHAGDRMILDVPGTGREEGEK